MKAVGDFIRGCLIVANDAVYEGEPGYIIHVNRAWTGTYVYYFLREDKGSAHAIFDY